MHRRVSKETGVLRLIAVFLAIVWSGWAADCPIARAADAGPEPGNWKEYVLGDNDGLEVVMWVKSTASLADADWMKLEITNNGTAGQIRDLSIRAPAVFGASMASGILSGAQIVGYPGHGANSGSLEYTIPEGKFSTDDPGLEAAQVFGMTTKDLPVTVTMSFSLTLEDGRSVQTPEAGVPITFTWTKPPDKQTASRQAELAGLLAKTVPNAEPKAGGVGSGKPFSPYLNPGENARLSELLMMPEVTQAVTLEQALATLKQCELDDPLMDYADTYGRFMSMVTERWEHDPRLIAFYQEALASRSNAAIMELFSPMSGVWDDSFVEPLVEGVETRAQPVVKALDTERIRQRKPRPRPAPEPTYGADIVFDDDLMLLDRHYSSWANDPDISTRLSKAVLTSYPELTGNGGADANRGVHNISNGITQLALTHDRAMIAVLRRFLTDGAISELGVIGEQGAPLRVSEIAANAIAELLGEPELYDGLYSNAGVSDPGPNPVWEEWDKKNAELAKHVEALLKDGKSSGG